MAVSACISDEALELLLLGKLPEADAEPLDEHLLHCPTCVARTRSLAGADTLVAELQPVGQADGMTPADAAAVSRLVARISDRSQFGTVSSMLDATHVSGTIKADAVAAIVAQLDPPAGSSELGRLGGFRVLSLLGQGGMGAVFLAEDLQLRRPTALKVLKPELAGQRDGIDRFLREARAAAAVRHDHVVTIYQVGEFKGVPFLAQELLEGETLDSRLKREGRLPVANALRIGREIADGLAAAHRQGLLHRDIKPSNIWLEGKNARVKILDFGLARHEQGDDQLTQSGAIVGTPAYMSPEQAQGLPLDVRSDLFSFGSVMYRIITGRQPFSGHDTLSCLRSLAVDDPPAPQSLNSEVPAELSDLIVELLQKDRTRRPAAAELVSQRLAGISPIPLPSPQAAIAAAQPPRNRIGTRWLASGAAAVVILAAIIITITRRDGTKTNIEVSGDVAAIDISQKTQGPAATQTSSISVSTASPAATWAGWPAGTPAPAIAPFNADQAKARQEAWAKHLGVPVEYTNSLGMKLQLIPPGEFVMGASEEEINELIKTLRPDEFAKTVAHSQAPRHRVILTKPFYLGKYEVTQGEYERVMGKNPSYFSATGEGKGDVAGLDTSSFPVEMVSWFNAAEFCAKVSEKERFASFYSRAGETVSVLGGNGYRLPTEAEWEFACRAGTTTWFWHGDSISNLANVGWHLTTPTQKTHPVGQLLPNPFGLYDVHGNVWERCHDWWDLNYYSQFAERPAINPEGPFSGNKRIRRGGYFGNNPVQCASSARFADSPNASLHRTGFRVVLGADSVRKPL